MHARQPWLVLLLMGTLTLTVGQCPSPGSAPVRLSGTPVYAKLHFLPAGSHPDVYLRFEGGSLFVAATPQGLASAKPVKPTHTGDPKRPGHQIYDYPWVDLPGTKPDGTPVRAALSIEEPNKRIPKCVACVHGEFQFRARDKSGASWDYARCSAAPVVGATSASRPVAVDIPTWDALTLGIETKVQGTKVRIGLRVGPDWQHLVRLTRNGKQPSAQIQVLDSAGKAVKTQKGDLKTFGFT